MRKFDKYIARKVRPRSNYFMNVRRHRSFSISSLLQTYSTKEFNLRISFVSSVILNGVSRLKTRCRANPLRNFTILCKKRQRRFLPIKNERRKKENRSNAIISVVIGILIEILFPFGRTFVFRLFCSAFARSKSNEADTRGPRVLAHRAFR